MRTLLAVVVGIITGAVAGAQQPQFTKDNRLMRPADYRDWVYLSSGIGMTYGPARATTPGDNPAFENVFVNPAAYKAFKQTGAWPEGTIFVLEIRASESKGSINQGGHYQTGLQRFEAEVKDKRFEDGWAFFGFDEKNESAQAIPKTAGCQACHSKNGAVENTFVQFYPTLLPVAKEKGTLKK
jgi:hypothetical protein